MKHSANIESFTATALATDGRAIARDKNGIVVFIKNMLPGETGKANILLQKSSYKSAVLTEIEVSSPERVEPPCPFVDNCGGCQLQHLSADKQTQYKSQWFLETLKRVGKWDIEVINLAEKIFSIFSLKKDHYRRRLRLHFDGEKLGFKKNGTNIIVDIPYCYIASSNINIKLPSIKENLIKSWHKIKKQNNFQKSGYEIEVTQGDNNFIYLHPTDLIADKDTDLQIKINHPELENFHVHKKSFVQPHMNCIEYYYTAIRENINDFLQKKYNTIPENKKFLTDIIAWDLYAGSGVFTPIFHFLGERLGVKIKSVGIEGVKEAVSSLKENCKNLHVHSEVLDVSKFVAREFKHKMADPKNYSSPSLVILNPPRTGVGLKTMHTFVKLCAQEALVLYLACDPACFARDTQVLLKAGFNLKSLSLFDSFAHTVHYEVLGCFERN